jgi:hypothetical protein
LPLCGCATLGQITPSWLSGDGLPHGPVSQVAALWADGIVENPYPNEKGFRVPTRGFAGRVYLFNDNTNEAVVADGTLIIQMFDVTQADAPPKAPRETWTIAEDNLQHLLKKDGLGWGYNLWLPWQSWSGDIEKVAFVVAYRPKNGQEIWSGNTIVRVNTDGKSSRPSQLKANEYVKKPQPANKS